MILNRVKSQLNYVKKTLQNRLERHLVSELGGNIEENASS